MTTKLKQAALDLLEGVEAAIKAGDWKIDGACDPDLAMYRLREALANPEERGTSRYEGWVEVAEQMPVAHTNKEQLRCLKDQRYKDMPMAMWSRPFETNNVSLYAAPVRTKDLTDDEIEQVRKSFGDEVISAVAFARAVIAADREKNK